MNNLRDSLVPDFGVAAEIFRGLSLLTGSLKYAVIAFYLGFCMYMSLINSRAYIFESDWKEFLNKTLVYFILPNMLTDIYSMLDLIFIKNAERTDKKTKLTQLFVSLAFLALTLLQISLGDVFALKYDHFTNTHELSEYAIFDILHPILFCLILLSDFLAPLFRLLQISHYFPNGSFDGFF
ncbi:hypothetical protein FGO68_gene17667 [Halteria grandinella]|uniref:Uncharacterized protein n=1 Tax=Halteria grandinella TaxID=5974 RepID=A0A8J8NHM2_HALGN|nr:hypothetical protein FGO68_gene17667 [Halteria grandinella]